MSSPSVLMRPLEDYLDKSFKDILLKYPHDGWYDDANPIVDELKRFLSVGEMQKVLAEVYAPAVVSTWSPFSFLSKRKQMGQGIWVIILKMKGRPSRFAYPYQLIIGYADANRVVVGPTYAILPNRPAARKCPVLLRLSKLPPPFDKAGGPFMTGKWDYSPKLISRLLDNRTATEKTTKEQRDFYGIPDNTKLKLLFIPAVHTDKEQVFLNWPKTGMVPLFKLVSTR